MKYFIDTEFIEGFHKPAFGKRRHFIDLISIGIVCEDGRTYYAISKEFNQKDADCWVKENVISKLPEQSVSFYDSPRMREDSLLWKFNNRIKNEIIKFIYEPFTLANAFIGGDLELKSGDIDFYAYYADYDWVVFCSLFGRMIDLPDGFPMYCKDLKQILDEKAKGHSPLTLEANLSMIKNKPEYPYQFNEHSALDDAKWNFELFKFLEKL